VPSTRPTKAPVVPVCGIGASAGGVEALQRFFLALPNDLGLAYVVIVHLAPDRKSDLPALLARWTTMPVTQVGDHDTAPLSPNHVYVIAPDRKLEITDTSVGASRFEQPRGQRAAIDLFFRSLAASHGDGFAVVLSGSGTDGTLGARAVKERGGLVLVQDPSDAVHGDMPQAVITSGVADVVLPVPALVEKLAELARSKDRIQSLVDVTEDGDRMPVDEDKALQSIFDLLKSRHGHDFSNYKRNMVVRRLARRMQLAHHATIAEYLRHAGESGPELQTLFHDLLIPVTGFFRDPEAWAALQSEVIRPLVAHTGAGEQIRAWVPACSTGEEAYTLAILFREELDRHDAEHDLIIFASDVDERALAVAREGRYPSAISADVSEARLDRYFRAEGNHYRLMAPVRDHVVYAVHSVLRDPPFARLHLVSCRNLLIYLDRQAQEQAMAVFRYACRDRAYLFLGASEMPDEELFQALDKKHRIFHTRELGDGVRPPLPDILAAPTPPSIRRGHDARSPSRTAVSEIHLAALEEVAPPSVLVDQRWMVLHLSGSAARFLQQSGGPLAHRIADLVRPELRDELHALLHRAFEGPEPQLSPFITVAFDGTARRVAILAQRRRPGQPGGPHVLVTFLDGGEVTRESPTSEQEPATELVRSLRERLRQAERRIETMRDDHYLTNEDLRAANEELQSLNEEYRSTTEELETSKEELQSINEELQTVNQELKVKFEELSQAHSDLENLMAATNVATLFLDRELRITRYTPSLTGIVNVKTGDKARPIGDLTHALDYRTLEDDARSVLDHPVTLEREATSRDGRVFLVRLHPYRKAREGIVDGIVVTFFDLTILKRAEAARRESERKLEAELDVMRVLHRVAAAVTAAPTLPGALDELLAAAITVTGADLGHIQLLDPESQRLSIVAHRGFGPRFLETFASVAADDESACGRALRTRETCCIEDVTRDPAFAPYRDAAAAAGYRAVQSEPLIAKGGELVGILSIHFREPRTFSERDRYLGGLIARQIADLILSRRQQEHLARLNEALRRRAASEERLSRQASELLEQDRNKEEFLAALGHELRNPMAAIQNGLEVISTADERSRRALAIMKRQVEHITRLINDLLDIARINRGLLRVHREVVELDRCVLAAVETVRGHAEAKGLSLEVDLPDPPVHVEVDSERLVQILDNLLSNAVIYTERGGITVTARRDGPRARIAIRDTGIGVDPGQTATVFNAFHQTAEGRRHGGLGLGLTLVKRLVEMHGGTVELRSEGRGTGSEVIFTLPLARSAMPVPSPSHASPSAPRRILVVDDQQDAADMLGVLLETIGHDVRVAYDGPTALETARAQHPQVAFVDLSMPGMDGTEIARRLRQEFSAAELTLVALSGYAQSYVDVQSSHFDRHLLKPATTEGILTVLNSLSPSEPT
jgi:two-component system CheB/CheR fusion protein